jgi:hypothetical protein
MHASFSSSMLSQNWNKSSGEVRTILYGYTTIALPPSICNNHRSMSLYGPTPANSLWLHILVLACEAASVWHLKDMKLRCSPNRWRRESPKEQWLRSSWPSTWVSHICNIAVDTIYSSDDVGIFPVAASKDGWFQQFTYHKPNLIQSYQTISWYPQTTPHTHILMHVVQPAETIKDKEKKTKLAGGAKKTAITLCPRTLVYVYALFSKKHMRPPSRRIHGFLRGRSWTAHELNRRSKGFR